MVYIAMKSVFTGVLFLVLGSVLFSCISKEIENPSRYEISKETKYILKNSKVFPGYNGDYKTRDSILGINHLWAAGDSIRKFSGLTIQEMDELLAGKFIGPDDAHLDGRRAREFFDFMLGNPQVSAHGYAISPNSPNYGIVLTGMDAIDSTVVTPMLKKNFIEFCKGADSLYTENTLYSDWNWVPRK